MGIRAVDKRAALHSLLHDVEVPTPRCIQQVQSLIGLRRDLVLTNKQRVSPSGSHYTNTEGKRMKADLRGVRIDRAVKVITTCIFPYSSRLHSPISPLPRERRPFQIDGQVSQHWRCTLIRSLATDALLCTGLQANRFKCEQEPNKNLLCTPVRQCTPTGSVHELCSKIYFLPKK